MFQLTEKLFGYIKQKQKRTPWPEFASELYRPSDLRLSVMLVPTFADRRCHVVSVTVPYGRILGFLDRGRYFFLQAAPQLYLRGWVDHVPEPLLLRKSGSAEKSNPGLWICSQELWPFGYILRLNSKNCGIIPGAYRKNK
jgi:hypothetical protein